MNTKNIKQLDLTTYSASEMTFSRNWLRTISATLIVLCSFVWYTPAVYAAVHEWEDTPEHGLASFSPLAYELKALRGQLLDLQAEQPKGLFNKTKARFDLKHQFNAFKQQDELYRVQREQQLIRAQEQGSDLSQRIESNIALYKQQSDVFIHTVEALLNATWRASQVSDPKAPFTQHLSRAIELASHYIERPYQSYGNDLDFIEPPPRTMYDTQASIESLVGQSGGVGSDLGLSDIEYLETDEATQSSPLIQDVVNQIGTDPTTLYNWVHDNITWLPQYGLMQSADYTLQAEQGNAFDISSLLIALLREAGYPARYVYGAVAVEPEDLRNWVGDVVNNDAAINLLSQGGIPQQIGTLGSAEVELQLEHVWVQVKVGGVWIDLDASLKDVEYSEGVDLQTEVAFDAEGLIADLEASATSNESEGWVQGVDTALIESTLTDYQTELENYIDTQMPNATLGDVLGLANIVPSGALTLDQVSTRFTRTLASQPLQHLPDNLKYQFQLQIGAASGGSLGIPVEWAGTLTELSEPTTALLGQSIAISFSPATEADQGLLESYLPETITTVEDLPDSLPAGDVYMVGEITLDGQTVATTSSQPLGAILMTRLGFKGTDGTWRYTENNLIVGQYQAVGIDMQGLSPTQLEALQDKLETTQQQLEAEDYTNLTKHEVTGDLLQAGIQGYLATTYAMDKVAALNSNIVYIRRPSYGTFSTQMEVAYLFGVPQTVSFGGVVMDADRVSMNTEHKENCYEDWLAFNSASGIRSSSLEHEIPDRLFSTPEHPAEGVSTAKALAIATTEGQRIYTLTEDNREQLDNIDVDDGAREQINAALDAGLEVTVHETPITLNGWTGSGYTLIEPDYGVGGYMISGSVSGLESENENTKEVSAASIFNPDRVLAQKLSNYYELAACIVGGIVSLALDYLGYKAAVNYVNTPGNLWGLFKRITRAKALLTVTAVWALVITLTTVAAISCILEQQVGSTLIRLRRGGKFV